MLTVQELVDALNANGLDTKEKAAAFVANSLRPVKRAVIQGNIDDLNKAHAAARDAHDEKIRALQAALNDA